MADLAIHSYVPCGAALKLFHDRSPEVLLSGPAGTGKSRACLEKLLVLALMNPGMRALMVRKTRVSISSTGLITFREHVAKEAIGAGHLRWISGGSAPSQYVFNNGSTITMGGLDTPSRIMSSEYDVIFVQEAIELTLTDWESLTTRLRNNKISFQQIIADTNPAQPTHWLKQRCDVGRTNMYTSLHEDNPTLVDPDTREYTKLGAEYLAKLDNLTGVRYMRLRKGLWVPQIGRAHV